MGKGFNEDWKAKRQRQRDLPQSQGRCHQDGADHPDSEDRAYCRPPCRKGPKQALGQTLRKRQIEKDAECRSPRAAGRGGSEKDTTTSKMNLYQFTSSNLC